MALLEYGDTKCRLFLTMVVKQMVGALLFPFCLLCSSSFAGPSQYVATQSVTFATNLTILLAFPFSLVSPSTLTFVLQLRFCTRLEQDSRP